MAVTHQPNKRPHLMGKEMVQGKQIDLRQECASFGNCEKGKRRSFLWNIQLVTTPKLSVCIGVKQTSEAAGEFLF